MKRVEGIRDHHSRLIRSREVKLQLLESEFQRQEDPEAPVNLVMLINQIVEANYQATVELAINLDGNQKTQYDNEWRTQHERVAILEKQKLQVFSMVRGQCTQIMMDKMKYNPDWYTSITSYDTLKFMALIENTILNQT